MGFRFFQALSTTQSWFAGFACSNEIERTETVGMSQSFESPHRSYTTGTRPHDFVTQSGAAKKTPGHPWVRDPPSKMANLW
jgi:hypothetical protein